MKVFFNEEILVAGRIKPDKNPFEELERIFETGATAAMISCEISQNFFLINPETYLKDNVSSELNVTLSDVLSKYPEKKFIIELHGKGNSFAEEYAQAIKEFSMEERIVTSSGNSSFINRVRRLMPMSATAMTYAELLKIYFLHKSGILYFFKSFKADALLSYEMLGVSFILNEQMIQDMRSRGIFALAITDGSYKQISRLYESGCRGFVAENPELILNYIKGNTTV